MFDGRKDTCDEWREFEERDNDQGLEKNFTCLVCNDRDFCNGASFLVANILNALMTIMVLALTVRRLA